MLNHIVLKLEKIVRTDLKYIFRGGAYMFTEYVVSVVLGISFGFLIANVLNPTEYGIYKYILSVGGAIGALTFTGFSASLAQSIAKGFDGSFREIGLAQFRWSIPALCIGFGVGITYILKDAYVLGVSIFLITFFIPLRDFGILSDAYLTGKELFKLKAKFNIIRNIVATVLLAGIALSFSRAHIIVISQYLVEAIGFLLILWTSLQVRPLENERNSNEISFAKHLSVVDVIQRLSGQFDKLLIFQLLGATALGLYSIALLPVLQLTALTKIVRLLVAPRFAKRSFQEIHATIFHKALIMFLCSFFVMVVYYFAIPLIFRYLLPRYVEVISLAQLASLLLLFTPQTLFGQVLVAQGCKRELYISAISGNIFFFIFIIMGVHLFGIYGGVIGFILSRGLNFLTGVIMYFTAYNRTVKI